MLMPQSVIHDLDAAASTAGIPVLAPSADRKERPDAVIASGLAPVFGLMRNANLAYGLNLLGVMNAFLE